MKHALGVVAVVVGGLFASSSLAATVTDSIGGPPDGFAKSITYDDALTRSTDNNRHIATNALGATNGTFFELLIGEVVDFGFGTLFQSPGAVVEVTFNNVNDFFESVKVSVGTAPDGPFTEVIGSPISNADAQGPTGAAFTFAGTGFSILRMEALESPNGLNGFDVDSVKVTEFIPPVVPDVPLPAGGLLLISALAGAAAFKARKKA